MPEAGATDFLHTKKVGVQQGLTRRALLGDANADSTGAFMKPKYLGTARDLGSQASLSVLYSQVTLSIAKDGWAVGGSPGCHWGGSIKLHRPGLKASLQPCPHYIALGRPFTHEPHTPHL